MYKCPYCQTVLNKTKKCNFDNWESVRRHTSTCSCNTGEYFIDLNEGPIHYTNIYNNWRKMRKYYPNLKAKLGDITKSFNRRNINLPGFKNKYTEQELLEIIQEYYKEYGKIPTSRDFRFNKPKYPGDDLYLVHFGSWNNAIKLAGFEPNEQNGFGINTYGKDKHLYRSTYEALFSDIYLYNKYTYIIEPKYPKPYNKYYDWYIKELDLYIELDGGLRPETIKEKIVINKDLNRKLLIIKCNDINNFSTLEDFLE